MSDYTEFTFTQLCAKEYSIRLRLDNLLVKYKDDILSISESGIKTIYIGYARELSKVYQALHIKSKLN